MTVPLLVTADSVRGLLNLQPDSTSRYSDGTIQSNIRTSLELLEQAAGRYFYDRPGLTLTLTSEGQAQVALPGLRTITSVTWNLTALTLNETYWLWQDELRSGMYMAVSIRPFVQRPEGPIWLASPQWFDRGLDLHRYPVGTGYGPYDQGSLPGDIVVVGDGGWASGTEPNALLDAIRIFAAWKTLRAPANFSGNYGTGDGNVFDLSEYPVEVQRFVRLWRYGQTQAVSL